MSESKIQKQTSICLMTRVLLEVLSQGYSKPHVVIFSIGPHHNYMITLSWTLLCCVFQSPQTTTHFMQRRAVSVVCVPSKCILVNLNSDLLSNASWPYESDKALPCLFTPQVTQG